MTATADWRDVLDPMLWPHEAQDEPFLVESLVSSTYTTLAAEPAVGKTHFAVALVAALMNGEPEFLGQPVKRHVRRVAIVGTDPKAPETFRRRLLPLLRRGGEGQRVLATSAEGWRLGAEWDAAREMLVHERFDLLVVDHIIGLATEPREPVESKRWTTLFTLLASRGCAVLALTHTAKPGENGPAHGPNAPYGHRIWGAVPRTVLTMTVKADGIRTLTAHNNDGPTMKLGLTLGVEQGSPVWTAGPAPAGKARTPRERKPSTLDKRFALAARVVDESPPEVKTKAAAYRWLSAQGEGSEAHLKGVLAPLLTVGPDGLALAT